MITRVLPPAEWSKLVGTELEFVWPVLNPDASVILVVESDTGDLLGCWAILQVWHAEGLWIAPEYRKKTSVGRRLLNAVFGAACQAHIPNLVTAALTDEVARLITKCGGKVLPGTHFVLPTGGVPCQPLLPAPSSSH